MLEILRNKVPSLSLTDFMSRNPVEGNLTVSLSCLDGKDITAGKSLNPHLKEIGLKQ